MKSILFSLLFTITYGSESYTTELLNLIKKHEGKSNVVYLLEGRPHIGFGHLLLKNEVQCNCIKVNGIKLNLKDGLSDQQIDDLLRQDLKWIIKLIDRHIKVKLNPNQRIAVKSYLYNVGYHGIYKNGEPTKFLKLLNQGKFKEASKEMDINTAGGKFLKSLESRRQDEQNLFNKPWRKE